MMTTNIDASAEISAEAHAGHRQQELFVLVVPAMAGDGREGRAVRGSSGAAWASQYPPAGLAVFADRAGSGAEVRQSDLVGIARDHRIRRREASRGQIYGRRSRNFARLRATLARRGAFRLSGALRAALPMNLRRRGARRLTPAADADVMRLVRYWRRFRMEMAQDGQFPVRRIRCGGCDVRAARHAHPLV